MDARLKQLTEEIYAQGVEKARHEAEGIIENAKREAEKILSAARAEKDSLMKAAQTETDALRARTASELKMSSEQAVTALRQEISGLLSQTVLEKALKPVLSESDFIRNLILETLRNPSPAGELVLPENLRKDFEAWLAAALKDQLKAGLKVTFSRKLQNGFTLSASGGTYEVSYTEADFNRYFQGYVKGRLRQILFPGA